MPRRRPTQLAQRIISRARLCGVTLAGIAPADALRQSPSHRQGEAADLPPEARSVLVLALAHPAAEPALDWWDQRPGHTPGNRALIRAAGELAAWMEAELHLPARDVPYGIDNGGVFLKDAAALAGLGVIGRNNLLVTPAFGPRVRLRALLLEADLPAAPPLDFHPCEGCPAPCRRACPRQAFGTGAYRRPPCRREMDANEANPYRIQDVSSLTYSIVCVKYCRACELACPVAAGR
jgi:epoxyqueuosine reductase